MMAFVREINPNSEDEINLVASRMRDTLVDVLGADAGQTLYSVEWLQDRVKWHLSPERNAAVFLIELENKEIVAQAIVRTDTDPKENLYGYFSTIYVTPAHRSQGFAKLLIETVQQWCYQKKLPYITYNTADTNQRVIDLFKKNSFEINLCESRMVQLKKTL